MQKLRYFGAFQAKITFNLYTCNIMILLVYVANKTLHYKAKYPQTAICSLWILFLSLCAYLSRIFACCGISLWQLRLLTEKSDA